jgi:hypothetical protein
VTASEFSFLALGLVLGVVSGAAIVEIVRARPRVAPEVKVTVTHDAIPRRVSTLADDAFTGARPEPARGGPADRRWSDGVMPPGAPDRRTTVRFATAGAGAGVTAGTLGAAAIPTGRPAETRAIPVGPGPIPVAAPINAQPSSTAPPGAPSAVPPSQPSTVPASQPDVAPTQRQPPIAPTQRQPDEPRGSMAVPVAGGHDPILAALLVGTPTTPRSFTLPARPATDVQLEAEEPTAMTAIALLDPPRAAASSDAPPPGAAAAAKPAPTERCAEERRIAEERCELATRARGQAEATAEALRQAQRDYDAHEGAAREARERSDARAIQVAKDQAQGGFRASVRAAEGPDDLEAAARDWLNEINRINNEAKDAAARAVRESGAAAEIASRLERLGLEADAARIGAENADAACLAARAAVADCDERVATDPSTFLVPPAPAPPRMPDLVEDESLGSALGSGGTPRVFRLLRGDRVAMATIVTALAGDDAEARRRWQLQLSGLIEAILADAIVAGYLEFPDAHPFWGSFTRAQNRDIVQALSSLGYRFDGLGGWSDGRFPSQRDLSLALGYAGLDPMRMRHWPNEEATAGLFRDVTVAADEYLAGVAGDLTLGEMVTTLGRRADPLADIWNQWGRIRPLLLEEG